MSTTAKQFYPISVQGDFFVRERASFPDVNQNGFHWLNFARAFFLLCYVTNERFRVRSFQTRFGEERNFLAKSFKMGTAWSYCKEKRREKKELKRCDDFSFI